MVDDASSVPATEALPPAATDDPRLRVVRLPGRRGAAGARNAGLAEATADLVAFLDDDDTWAPDKVARQVALFERHGELGLVTCDYTAVDAQSDATSLYRGPARFSAGQVQWMNLPGSFSFVMARRSALGDELRLDESFPSVEDWDLWLRCARKAPVGVVPVPLCHHVVHGGLSRPSSERLGLERFLDKHGSSLPATCRTYLKGHLRMYRGTGWRKRVAVMAALATPSARASSILAVEQLLRPLAARRRDPGLVPRTVATLVGDDGTGDHLSGGLLQAITGSDSR